MIRNNRLRLEQKIMMIVYPGLEDLTQAAYETMIRSLRLEEVECSCGNVGDFQFFGTYKRKVKNATDSSYLRIQRVFCNHCKTTHAVIPSNIVPYDQILLKNQIAIIHMHENGNGYRDILYSNPEIDENNIAAIIRRYKKNWIKEIKGTPAQGLSEDVLIKECFEKNRRQFLQIRTKNNILIIRPT